MSANDRIILNGILDQRRQAVAPDMTPSAYFELFVAEQLLKDYDLSYEEIESGILGGGGDGGLDSVYLFVSKDLIQEDSDLSTAKKNVAINLVIIQSKTTEGFTEGAMDKFNAVTRDLLDLTIEPKALAGVYNTRLLDMFTLFRKTQTALAPKFPNLTLSYYYVTKGDDVHPNVRRKERLLNQSIADFFPAATCDVRFVGAGELLEIARRSPSTTYQLKLAETPISSTGAIGYVCLVTLQEYFRFITNEHGNLARSLFESNVRDYQGSAEVNEAIQATLRELSTEEFWWLNNGITIVANSAQQGGKVLTIEDPQIVNGLQTSTEIFNYYSQQGPRTRNDEKTVLVRVIVPLAAESRDRIIKATNSQTKIPEASLRATDKIHRDIEEFLKPRGLFYDRRKNYYKNDGKPVDKIISIPHLAQAVMAIALQRPNDARARPSSLLKRDADYQTVFNPQYPLQMYYICVLVMKEVDKWFRSCMQDLKVDDRTNLRYYVAMDVAARVVGRPKPTVDDLGRIKSLEITPEALRTSFDNVKGVYDHLGGNDQVSKGTDMVRAVSGLLVNEFKQGQ